MPESIRSCGVLKAPPARMTSRERVRLAQLARRVAGLGMGAVEPLALQVLDADRAVALVEQDSGRQRVELDAQPVGIPLGHLEQPLARAGAAVVARGERRVAHAVGIGLDDVAVVGVAGAAQEPARCA